MPAAQSDSPLFNARVAYIYSDLPSYSRAKKSLVLLRDLCSEVHFIGTRRQHSWDDDWPQGVQHHIRDEVMGTGLATIPDVARFVGYIRERLRRIRPHVVIAVNEEYILPFTVGALEKPPALVLDLYDSIGMRVHQGGRWIRPPLRLLSALAMLSVDALIEVTEERLAWHPYKPDVVSVIHNAPPRIPDLAPMKGLPARHFLYVAGTMQDQVHGLETLTAALDRVPRLHVIATGKPKGEFATGRFLKHPRVHFLGLVPYEDVPRIAMASLGMYIHVSPSLLNYVYGAPNKLYEAMQAGVPVVINRENTASRLARRHRMGLTSPYGDVDALTVQLQRLVDERDTFAEAGARARHAFLTEYAWDRMARERYIALFDQLGVRRATGTRVDPSRSSRA